MKNTNVLLMFVILAIIFAALWVGTSNIQDSSSNQDSSPETVYANLGSSGSYPIPVPVPIPFGGGGHHHQHNLGPGGQHQPNLGPGGQHQPNLGPGGQHHQPIIHANVINK